MTVDASTYRFLSVNPIPKSLDYEIIKARLLIAAYKELISERPSFELSGASKKTCRPISCVKIHSESIADIFFDIRNL